jgi:hypothetical protein
MQFMTPTECTDWAKHMGIALDARGVPVSKAPDGWHGTRVEIPRDFTELAWFSSHLEQALQPRTACLMWVTLWGVSPSSENLHLYYRLRESYGDRRQLHDAPGHYFLDYETADLRTFIQLALLFGWDAQLFPVTGFARAVISHDEFVEFLADEKNPAIAAQFAAPFTTKS